MWFRVVCGKCGRGIMEALPRVSRESWCGCFCVLDASATNSRSIQVLACSKATRHGDLQSHTCPDAGIHPASCASGPFVVGYTAGGRAEGRAEGVCGWGTPPNRETRHGRARSRDDAGV